MRLFIYIYYVSFCIRNYRRESLEKIDICKLASTAWRNRHTFATSEQLIR